VAARDYLTVADVFLRINGWRLCRSSTRVYGEMIQMFEAGSFDMAHLEPWLRDFAMDKQQS